MFKKMNNFINELNTIIGDGVKGFKINLFALIFAFIALNTLGSIVFNLYKSNNSLKGNYKLSLYFKGNPSEEDLNRLEGNLLKMPEVLSLKYESKQVALMELENQLGISVSRGRNPLSDNFIVTFNGSKNLESLQEKLDNESLIKKVFVDEEYIKNLDKEVKRNEMIAIWLLISLFVPLLVITFTLFHSNILYNNKEIVTKVYLGEIPKKAVKPYYTVGKSILLGASLVGTLTFLNLYTLFRRSFVSLEERVVLASPEEILYISVIMLVIIVLLFPIVSKSIYRVSGE